MISLLDIDLNIKERMESIRLKANETANAKTFSSCYIWSKQMDIKIYLEDDMYAVKNNSHGELSWNFPVGEEKAKIDFINKLIYTKGLKLLKLTTDDVCFLNEHFPNTFTIEQAPEDSEYIYDAEEHAIMAGKNFSSLRRLLNKFNREHETKTVMLTKHNMSIAEKIMMSWGLEHEVRVIIENYDKIGMIGILIYIDNYPSAVAMGYPISSDICDIAETKFIPTISNIGYIATKEFMKAFKDTYRYFNDEEDMGIAGLREYKTCMKPCRMNVLWNAYLKGE